MTVEKTQKVTFHSALEQKGQKKEELPPNHDIALSPADERVCVCVCGSAF